MLTYFIFVLPFLPCVDILRTWLVIFNIESKLSFPLFAGAWSVLQNTKTKTCYAFFLTAAIIST
jgi:hypothetical protein